MPKILELIGGDQNKDLSSRNIRRRCVLATLWTVKLGLTMDGKQEIQLKYSEKSCILHQFRIYIFKRAARPRYTADNDTAENDVCAQNCQVAA